MPIYEYECLKCGHTTEAMQKFSDAPLSICSECGGQLRKLISNTSFVLKGTGWYKTDYAGKDSGSEGKKSPAKEAKAAGDTKADKSEAKSEVKSESSSSEAKSETKKEPAPAS